MKKTRKYAFKMSVILIGLMLLLGGAFSVLAETDAERKIRLERELSAIEAEIAAQEVELAKQRNESGSIQRDLNVLSGEIKQKRLEIEKRTRQIRSLGGEISRKNKRIDDLNNELGREKSSLAQILRNTRELEEISFIEFMAGDQSISEVLIDIDSFQTLQVELQDSFDNIRYVQEQTEEEKKALEEKKNEEANKKYEIEQEKKKVEAKEDEKEVLLGASKNKEKSYEQVIKDRKAKAAQIRSAIFELRASNINITFGEAYDIAKSASQRTGVDTAFLLAVWKQESGLGRNVGTCNRPGDTRTWRDIMPGPNDNSWRDDQTNFKTIVDSLGMSPEGQPLSCPLSSGGWGGAMGPAQFIPTTWLSYASRIASTVGVAVANPWKPSHAMTATALYMKDLGASAGTYAAERDAACQYYSGRKCSNRNVKNAFYGDAVMNHKLNIQGQIDVLESF